MSVIAAAAIAGGASIVSGIMGLVANKKARDEQMALYNIQLAREEKAGEKADALTREQLRMSKAQIREEKRRDERNFARQTGIDADNRMMNDYGLTQDALTRTSSLLNADKSTRFALANMIKGRR